MMVIKGKRYLNTEESLLQMHGPRFLGRDGWLACLDPEPLAMKCVGCGAQMKPFVEDDGSLTYYCPAHQKHRLGEPHYCFIGNIFREKDATRIAWCFYTASFWVREAQTYWLVCGLKEAV